MNWRIELERALLKREDELEMLVVKRADAPDGS